MILSSEKLKIYPEVLLAIADKTEGNFGIDPFTETSEFINSRKNFFQRLGILNQKIFYLKTKYNIGVKILEKDDKSIIRTGSLISNQLNTFLVLLTADCLPLVLFDPVNKVITLTHISWWAIVNQLARKVVKRLMKEFKTKPENLIAFIGPGICRNCYFNTGWRAGLKNILFKIKGQSKWVEKKENRIYFDLKETLKQQLIESGLKLDNFEDCQVCTIENNNFPSFRREGKKRKSSVLMVVGLKD